MTLEHGHVRAELRARIDAIAAARLDPAGLCTRVDTVRQLARSHGFLPVADLAHALESAIAGGARGPLVDTYLSLMHDAAGSDRSDAAARDAWLAAANVRLI